MRIAILSDTHSRHANIAKALHLLEPHDVEQILHCGDIEDADVIDLFRGLPVHFVYGNCDHDKKGIARAIEECGLTLHGSFGHLELAGRQIGFTHGDDKDLLKSMEVSEAFHYIFYGHTHVAREHRAGKTRVINPGALHRANPKTFVVLDLASGDMESIAVE
jgi:putative phosphoesterase